jgi:hemoglobin
MADERSLYERLGRVYVISKVIDVFSHAILDDPMVGRESENEQLSEWSNDEAEDRLQGLIFMRTLWLCDVAGGPFTFVSSEAEKADLNLKAHHCPLKITPEEFDRVAAILKQTLIDFKVGKREIREVLAAFAGHKGEVTACPFKKGQARKARPKQRSRSHK